MNIGTRTLKIYGSASDDARITVEQDGVMIFCDRVDNSRRDPCFGFGTELFKIHSRSEFNGFFRIRITVNSGSIEFGRSVAYYPFVCSRYNIQGSVAFTQMEFSKIDPKFYVKINDVIQEKSPEDQHLDGEWWHSANTGDVVSYYHLTHNGPSYFNLQLNADQLSEFESKNVVCREKVTTENSPQWPAVYDYDHVEQNLENLNNIKQQILTIENQLWF